MTDLKLRNKFPFSVISSSVTTGYATSLTSSVGLNIDIVNKHKDEYAELEGTPLQSPFTERHVGGNQHRHVNINSGNDNITNRPEAYFVSSSYNSIKIYGPDINGPHIPSAKLLRDNVAKSSINIKNIQTSGNIAGNFEYNYQVFQTVGRRTTNNLINDNFIASGSLTTKFVSGSHEIYSLPNIINNSKSIIVERFNAPGGKNESSRGALDREGEEYSPNNSLVTRNIKVRKPHYNKLTQHSPKFNSGSTYQVLPVTGNINDVAIHGVHRNSYKIVRPYQDSFVLGEEYDNYWVQRNIPRSELNYSWITASARSNPYDINGANNSKIENIIEDFSSYNIGEKLTTNNNFSGDGSSEVRMETSTSKKYFVLNSPSSLIRNLKTKKLKGKTSISFTAMVNRNSVIYDTTGLNLERPEATENLIFQYSFDNINWNTIETILTGTSVITPSTIQVSKNYVFDFEKSYYLRIMQNSSTGIGLDNYAITDINLTNQYIAFSFDNAIQNINFSTSSSFGDFLGISGAVDKEHTYISDVTNTMYRERRYLALTSSNDFYIEANSVSQDITEKDFTVSLWINIPKESTSLLNIFSASVTSIGYLGDEDTLMNGIFFNNDYSKMYTVGNSNKKIYEYSFIGTKGLVSGLIFQNSASISSSLSVSFGIRDLYFTKDGKKLYIAASNNTTSVGNYGKILYYSLATPWDISLIDMTSPTSEHVVTEDYGSNGLYFKPDGTRVYISAIGTDSIYQKTLSTPWDLTTTGSVVTLPVSFLEPQSINFSSDGKRLYVISNASDSVFYYDLSVAWDISSAILNTKNILNVSQYEGTSTGLFVDDSRNILYAIGTTNDRVIQFGLNANKLIEYSGSISDNILNLKIDNSGSYFYINGSEAYNAYYIKPNINDGKWHNVTLVSDLSTTIKKIRNSSDTFSINNTITKIYVDGALVTRTTQIYKKLDISKLLFFPEPSQYDCSFDEITIWNRALSENQINDLFQETKTYYGSRPKKYVEHKFKNSSIPSPIHVFSSRVDNINKILFNEVNNDLTASLMGYSSSLNLKPSINQIISYSTYFNGPYAHPSWKQIRGNEHPITRKLTTENTNIISVSLPESSKKINRIINGRQTSITLKASKRSDSILNIKEPPVYINKPLKHKFIFKGSVTPTKKGYEITHTYQNNISYFANESLNNSIGLSEKEEDQVYDTLFDYYGNEHIDEKDSPVEKFLGYTVEENIYPKKSEAFLSNTRSRKNYILNEPGYGKGGYDRQLGTQTAFWRDNLSDRMRTSGSLINSMGYQVLFGNIHSPSLAALEKTSNSLIISDIVATSSIEYIITNNISEISGAELNNKSYHKTVYVVTSSTNASYLSWYSPIEMTPEYYFFLNSDLSSSGVVRWNPLFQSGNNLTDNDTYSYRAGPKYTYSQYSIYTKMNFAKTSTININKEFYIDLGLNRYTEQISDKKPFYDSYENFMEDVRVVGKEYSTIPEFKISEHIKNAVLLYGGDFRKIKLDNVVKNIKLNTKDKLEKQNNRFANQDKITLKVNGIKKLLPYNGFYPQDKSLQLVNDLKESYIYTRAVNGGLKLHGNSIFGVSGYATVTASFYDNLLTSSYTLERYYKEASFLEPLFAPGIFYNLIKSGIAVEWPAFTGSIPFTGSYFNSFTGYYYSLFNNSPSYKMPFETILDIYNGFPESDGTESKRIVKSKPIIHKMTNASNYGMPLSSPSSGAYLYGYEGFCELSKTNNPLYSMNINNFLAETINFFLKDSKLNSFTSLPENRFRTFRTGKKYYMDVLLRKTDNFVMCQSYSSSLSPANTLNKARYFGPSFFTGSTADKNNIINSYSYNNAMLDPTSCAYAPPYFYGTSVARLSFTPSVSRKYTLEEIFSDIQVEYISADLNNDNYKSGSLYSGSAMKVDASVELFGQLEEPSVTFDVNSNINPALRNSNNFSARFGNASSINTANSNKKWVISTKMETPVLDFSQQEYTTDSTFFKSSSLEGNTLSFLTKLTQLTSSAYGVGMWSGYGEIPTGSEGIFFELKESFPNVNSTFRGTSTTGSLIKICGFTPQTKKIGELADQKTISEAIIIIPYSLKKKRPKSVRNNGNTFLFNDTVKIENYNLFKINRNIFQKQKTNIFSGKPAVQQGEFSSPIEIDSTSISNMITLMNKYVLPPNLNFLEYSDIHPFVMYIAEFESNLDKQDLSDIWQGVMPKLSTTAQLEENILSHDNSIHDFFHGEGMPEDIRFMIFKAKRKAEINYYKMTADSTDDERFRFNFSVGKKEPEYSYNWPYDYFSLVELAKIDLEIEYSAKDNRNISIRPGTNASQAIRDLSNTRAGTRGLVNRGVVRRIRN